MLLLLSWIGWVHASGVVINEIVVGADGSEGNWVELYNSSDSAVDMEGWTLEWGVSTATYDGAFVFDSREIGAGDFLLIGATDDAMAVADLTLGQGVENSDAVRLTNVDRSYSDTVVYGAPNTDEWVDDVGLVADSLAPSPADGASLGRLDDGVDSNASGTDFGLFDAATPGASNTVVTEDSCPGATSVKINEFLYNPEGSDRGKEWLELYNSGSEEISLAGWQLEVGKTASVRTAVVFGDDVRIASGAFLLLGESEVLDSDLTVDLDMGNVSNADVVRLRDCVDEIADTVVYGRHTEADLLPPFEDDPDDEKEPWMDDFGVLAVSTAPGSGGSDESLARRLDGVDTDASGDDFVVLETPTPGASNIVVEPIDSGTPEDSGITDTGDTGSVPPACVVDADIKINEAQIIPVTTTDEADHEWVELYNRGSVSVNLNGWRLEAGASEVDVVIDFGADAVIAPGAFLLVGGEAVVDPHVVAEMGLANAEADADMVRLVDSMDCIVDTLIYGTPNSDLWEDDLGVVADSTAPVPDAGESIARSPDGEDTNDAGLDFVVVETPTPGGPMLMVEDPCETSSDIKINEIVFNPDGADSGFEWVEIYNRGSEALSLANWELEVGKSSTRTAVVFDSSISIGPDSFVLVGEDAIADADFVAELDLGNAGSSADIVRLLDCNAVVADSLIYGTPNSDEWLDDSGEIATSLASKGSEGASVARFIDGDDTDACGDDFTPSETPTPGAPNAFASDGDADGGGDADGSPGGDSECLDASVKLNEVLVDPEGGDTGYEWIELYNAGSVTVDLDGWSVEGGSSSVGTYVTFEGLSLAAGAYLLIGDSEVVGADVLASITMGNAGSNSDVVRLVDPSDCVVDTLVYGSPNDDEWVDDSGSVATSLAPKAASGMTLARRSDGYDTNACADDWVVSMEPTPGSENPSLAPIECVEGSNQIKINEFMVDPDSALFGEDVTDADLEWVELYNGSTDTVAIEGWQLQWGKSGTFSGSVVFEADTDIGPGEWMLIGGALVSDADVITSFDMGNASGNSDAVRLVDCAEAVQDTVVYGPNNDDGWLDDEDEIASSFAESPGKEKSAARRSDGVDTDQSGVDFVVSDSPTPGATNTGGSVTDCVPGDQDIKINEILPDPEGTDDGFEFIELYNTSADDLSIEGWQIATGTSSWPSAAGFNFPAGASIPAGGFVVVAGPEVEGADFYTDDEQKFSLGNGSSAPDGVRLQDCTGEVQDTVLYGDPADPIEDLELDDDQGMSSMATMPESNMSVGRTEDGVDTDDNATDFTTNMPPTPGESNAVRDLAAGTSKGCGCGGKSEEPDGSDGPMEAGGLAGLLASLVMFVWMRRRD